MGRAAEAEGDPDVAIFEGHSESWQISGFAISRLLLIHRCEEIIICLLNYTFVFEPNARLKINMIP